MRLHSDVLNETDVRMAAKLAGATIERLSVKGSRSRRGGFDVILAGSSGRSAQGHRHIAATWDEWGVFLGVLYRRDPRMLSAYESAEHFTWSTGGRYATVHVDGHPRHRWDRRDVVTGAYTVAQCQCGAIFRQMANGRRFSEISGASVYESNGMFERMYLAVV